jgi:hypothetical protein
MKVGKLLPVLIALLLPLPFRAAAQSNALIDRLLAEKQATILDAAELILSASGIVGENPKAGQVMAALADRRLLPAGRTAEAPITLGEASYLIMRTLGMRGGLLYTMFPGPRYATRELAYLRLIHGPNTHPNRPVSGQEVVQMLGAALDRKAGRA